MNSTKPEPQAPNRADTYKLLAAGALILSALVAFYVFANHSLLVRVIGLLAAAGAAVAIALKTEVGAEALEFTQGARAELRKVVWPTRDETIRTTGVIIAVVIIISLILGLIDLILKWVVMDWLLTLGH